MDTSAYARLQRPGQRLSGERRSQDRHHLDGLDIVHAVIDDHSPRLPATGKVERFHQTMAREGAYGLVYRSHHERADALPHWLQHY